MAALTADGGDDRLEVFWGEVAGSEVLSQVIKDEQGELQALGLTAGEALRDDLRAETLNEGGDKVTVRLE